MLGEEPPSQEGAGRKSHKVMLLCTVCCRFKDKEVQRDAKMVSYKVVDKETKPYIEVEISGEKKVRSEARLS